MAFTYPCADCEAQVSEANVMIDAHAYYSARPKTVPFVKVICKPCTGRRDNAGTGPKLHNFWELSWFDKSGIRLLAPVLTGLTGRSDVQWHPEAVDEVFKILCAAHPTLCQDPLEP